MVSAEPPTRTAARAPDRVVELRAELWRRHALLAVMDLDDPDYDDAADAVLELTGDFLREVGERRAPRRSWLPRPRSAHDDRRR